MNELVINIIIECIIDVVAFLQMFMVGTIFLEQKKIRFLDRIIFWCTVVMGQMLFYLIGYDPIGYLIGGCIIIIFYLFTGKIVYKIFVVIMSFTLNLIAEIVTRYMVGNKVFDLLPFDVMESLFLQLGSAIVVLISISIMKSTKFIHFEKQHANKLYKVETMVLSLVTMLTGFLVIMAVNIFAGDLIVVGNIYFLSLVIVGALMLNVIIIVLMDRNIHTRYYKAMNDTINKQLENQVKYYEVIEQKQREVRSVKHDMRNHLICMGALLESNSTDELRNYTRLIQSRLENNDLLIQTGHIIIDVILNDKINEAKRKGIKIIDTLGNLAEVNLENVEICILLSNALDNAIEAAQKAVETKEAIVNIDLGVSKGYFKIVIKNTVSKKVDIKKGHFIFTTKEDRISHGYGMTNMKEVVEKYDGSLDVYSNDDFFILDMIIKLK